MDAAERLRDEGRMDDARFMLQQAKRLLAEPPGPALEIPEVPAEPAPAPPIAAVQAGQAELLAQQRGMEAALPRLPVTETIPAAEIVRQETEREREAIEAERARVIMPGVAEPVTVEEAGAPLFRPTRIVETPEGRLYRDPATGQLRPPTTAEEVRESFALQTITGEEEARRLAAAGAGEPLGILGTREAGAGIVETPFAAVLRAIPGYAEAALGEAYFRGLGYEVDEEGQPVDPEDFGLAVAELREKLGLPAVLRTPGLGLLAIPLPGVATTQRVAMELDPEGRRKVSTVEVPDPREDLTGFLDAEARRIAQNVAAGRTLGDEFRDAPELASYYERVWGDPDAAYWAGVGASLPIPVAPGAGGVVKALSAGVKKLVPTTELVNKADEAAEAARVAQAALAAEAAPTAMRAAQQKLEAAKLALIEAGGDAFANAGALAGVGRRGEERVAQRVADLVVESSGLNDAQKAAVRQELAAGVGRSGPEAQRAIEAAVTKVAPDQPEAARSMGRQALLNVPDDFVMVTETRAAPRAVAREVREVMQSRTQDAVRAEGEALAKLTPEARAVRVAAIQDEIADEVIPGLTRRTSDLGELQVFTHDATRKASDLARYRVFNTPTGRRLRVLSPGFKLDEVDAAARALKGKLARAGQTAGRQVSRELSRLSKIEGSVAGGLNRLMREQIDQTARALGEDSAAVSSTMWDKTLEGLVGIAGSSMPAIQRAMRDLVDVSKPPTVETIQALEASLAARSDLKFAAQGRFNRAADVQRAMLKALMEEGVKKQLGADAASYEALRQGLGDVLGPARGTVEELLLDPAAQDLAEQMARQVPVSALPKTAYRPRGLTDPTTDLMDKLATNAAELVPLLGKVEPRLRQSYAEMLKDALKYVAVPGRAALVQRAKYGYGIPNLPFLVYKGLETPFIAATQLGAARTLASLPRAGRSLLQRLTRRHLTGGGITTAEGVYYSPEELLRLGELEGLGITAVEAERLSLLTDDILAAARRASPEISVRSKLSPVQKGFWTRTAEAMEQSYRQGIFEAELIAGATPAQAAAAARKGALDYSEIPAPVQQFIEPMFPAASTAYKLASSVVIAGLQNPNKLNLALRALRENKRRQDPADLAGDSTISNLVVGEGDFSAYLPIPGVSQLLTAVEVARHGSNLITDLAQAAAVARATGRSTPAVWLERAGDQTVPLAWSVADAFFPPLLNAYREFEAVSAALPEKQQRTAREDAAMWAAAMWAHNADPEHDDVWRTFEQVFQWREVAPPADYASHRPGYWRAVPPGTPHIAVRDVETGEPLYKVVELTDAGRENLALMTALTPEELERAIPTASAMLQGNESAFSAEAPTIQRIFVPSPVDTWKEALISQFLNPTGIDFSDPEGVRKAQAERVLEIRAVPQ
jgi:hypothetical protein